MAGILSRPTTPGGNIEDMRFGVSASAGALTEPGATHRTSGWALGEKPSYKEFNYTGQKLWRWMARLRGVGLFLEAHTFQIEIMATGPIGYVRTLTIAGVPVSYTTQAGDTTAVIALRWAAQMNLDATFSGEYDIYLSGATTIYFVCRTPAKTPVMFIVDGNAVLTTLIAAPYKVRLADDDLTYKADVDLVFGSSSTEDTGSAGDDARFLFDKSKAAARFGRVNGTQWNDASRGDASMAWGENCTASGAHSTAGGSACTANAVGATAIGTSNTASVGGATALGDGNTASGTASFCAGSSNAAAGNNSTCIGAANSTGGLGDVAIGAFNTVSGANASKVGIGTLNNVTGTRAMGLGYANQATAEDATAVGTSNTVDGVKAAAIGSSNMASGADSFAAGESNNIGAAADNATAIGKTNGVTAVRGTAIGTSNAVGGQDSAALGWGNTTGAASESSMAIGSANTITGQRSWALGTDNTVAGDKAMALGADNTPAADYSRASGYLSEVSAAGEHGRADGYLAYTTNPGEKTYAGTQFGLGLGDTQIGTVHVKAATTDATPTELTAGGTYAWTPLNNGAYMVKVSACAKKTGAATMAAWEFQTPMLKSGGAITFPAGAFSPAQSLQNGGVHQTVAGGALTDVTAGGTVNLAFNHSAGSFRLVGTGLIGETWRWAARIESIRAGD